MFRLVRTDRPNIKPFLESYLAQYRQVDIETGEEIACSDLEKLDVFLSDLIEEIRERKGVLVDAYSLEPVREPRVYDRENDGFINLDDDDLDFGV